MNHHKPKHKPRLFSPILNTIEIEQIEYLSVFYFISVRYNKTTCSWYGEIVDNQVVKHDIAIIAKDMKILLKDNKYSRKKYKGKTHGNK